MTPRLRRALRPRSRAYWQVRRIVRRMSHYGGGSVPAVYRERGPTFRGVIGLVLQHRAARRKAHR